MNSERQADFNVFCEYISMPYGYKEYNIIFMNLLKLQVLIIW